MSSTKNQKNRFAPGGREYEKRKAQNKRRGGPRRVVRGETEQNEELWKMREKETSSSSGDEESTETKENTKESKENTKESVEEKGEKEEEEEEEEEEGSEEEGSEEEGESETKQRKAKGAEGLGFETHNINHENSSIKLVKTSEINAQIQKVQEPKNKGALSRKEREELERQRAKNKVEENDLARLAIIRQKREEAARKREEEKNAKEMKTKETAKQQGKKIT